jgi:hypothetical protein
MGSVLLAIILVAVGIFLPGCQTGHRQTLNSEGNAFEGRKTDGLGCRFG